MGSTERQQPHFKQALIKGLDTILRASESLDLTAMPPRPYIEGY